jgi:hypothetical protein
MSRVGPDQKVSHLILPVLLQGLDQGVTLQGVGEATDGSWLWFQLDEKNWLLVEDKQVRCVQHSVCATNRQLARELGATGQALGRYLRLVDRSHVISYASLMVCWVHTQLCADPDTQKYPHFIANKHILQVWETSTSSRIQPALKLQLQCIRTPCLWEFPHFNQLACLIISIPGIKRRPMKEASPLQDVWFGTDGPVSNPAQLMVLLSRTAVSRNMQASWWLNNLCCYQNSSVKFANRF